MLSPNTPLRLLVVLPSWVGDIVMATPTIRRIRDAGGFAAYAESDTNPAASQPGDEETSEQPRRSNRGSIRSRRRRR